MQVKTPFSKKFMDTAPLLVKAGLILPRETAELSKGLYAVPLPVDKITQFGSKGISPTHQGQVSNAIDFFVPEGTDVLAAGNGKVVELRSSSREKGMTVDFWDRGNFVEIYHAEFDEYTWYEHLMADKVFVKVGDTVKEGQVIALSGNTGFTEVPHLHFQVHRYLGKGWTDYITLRARLKWDKDPYRFND
jgi:murein DD-endopeptidase MepM/ murein hydrolase activator NlpD